MMRRLLSAGVMIAALTGAAAAGANGQPNSPHRPAKVTLRTFAGAWGGHTRGMRISRRGLAKERVDDGCCQHLFSAHYKLSKPRGSAAHPTVTATVIWAKVPDKSLFTDAFPAPKVGQKTTLTIKHTSQADILTVRARQITYCRHIVGVASPCGA